MLFKSSFSIFSFKILLHYQNKTKRDANLIIFNFTQQNIHEIIRKFQV